MRNFRILLFGFGCLVSALACGQDNGKDLDIDDQFKLARDKAFNGQRDAAREILLSILEKSPDYNDVRILLGRTYAWDGRRDEARREFQTVLQKSPQNLDAINAYVDVEMWDEKYEEAIRLADVGLKEYPNDEDLLYKKASSLNSLKRDEEALLVLTRLLEINPSHEKGNSLFKSIKVDRMKYIAGVSTAVDIFSRTFDPAYYASAQLSRQNNWGSSIVRVNYANRFGTNGIQPEVDLYPSVANGVYAYLNYGYSESGIFPKHRVGGELYFKLPHSFEASAGIRHLNFGANSKVNIFTGTVGWYVKNYWLSFRPYITPDKTTGTSFSGSLTARRYFADAQTFVGLSAGIGFSPDLRRIQSATGLSSDAIYLLHAQRAGIAIQKLFNSTFILNVYLDYARQELIFDEGNYVNIYSASLGLKKKF